MGFIVTCKTEEDPFKMRVLEWSQKISHCKSMQIVFNTQGQLTQQSEVSVLLKVQTRPSFMAVLVT